MGDRAIHKTGSSEKDIWDKVAALTVPFVTFVVGALGTYATYSYNASSLAERRAEAVSQLAQQKIQADRDHDLRAQNDQNQRLIAQSQSLQQLFTYVSSADPQKREFGYAMFTAMGQGELAARLIAAKQDKAGLTVLKSMASADDPKLREVANASLAQLVNVQSVGSVVMSSRASCQEFASKGFRLNRTSSTPQDIREVAQAIRVEPAALAAFIDVEASGSTLPDGRPKILFERHIFSRLTDGRYDNSHPGISSKTWGGYGAGGAHQYNRLTEAASLNCPAALAATSWGAFQFMGQNYKSMGYDYIDRYIVDVMSSGRKELEATVQFLKSAGLVERLAAKDWAGLARRYNGPNYKANGYDEKMAAAYDTEKQAFGTVAENVS